MKKSPTAINNRYHIENLLGGGGAGEVYRVRDLLHPNAPPLALKWLHLGKAHAEEQIQMLKNEFRILTSLNHPFLARVYDFERESESGRPFYTAEYVAGKNIFSATRSSLLDAKIQVLLKVCHALHYLHLKNVLHNDLKPENILVDAQAYPRVLDFGLSLARESAPQKKLWGTPAYLAPELIEGQAPSFQSDIFALGMVFYKVLTGRLPHKSSVTQEILTLNRNCNFPAPSKFQPEVADDLQGLMLRLLSKDPRNRPHSAQEIAHELSLISGQSLTAMPQDLSQVLLQIQEPIAKERPILLLKKFIGDHLSKKETANVAVIRGESGSGKTFLLKFLKRDYQVLDVPFLMIDCREAEGPFHPWMSVMKQIVGLMPKNSSVLASYQTFLSFLSAPQKSARHAFELQNREAFYFRFAEFLSASFEKRPFILAFDHADHLDAYSRDFFPYLANSPPILLALRDSSAHEGLFGDAASSALAIPSFTMNDCQRFLAKMFIPENAPQSFVEKIFALTGGNPQFIQETLRFLIHAEILHLENGHWNIGKIKANKIAIPPNLESLLQRRFEQLSSGQQKVLYWLATWNEPIDEFILKYLLAHSDDTLREDFRWLCQQQILIEDKLGAWDFSQPAFAKIIREGNPQNAAMHRKCAELREGQVPKPVERLAQHYAAAGDSILAAERAVEAATRASRIFAHEQARVYFQMAYEQSQLSPQTASLGIAALGGIADALWRQGNRRQALETYNDLLEHSSPEQNVPERLKALRARGIACRDEGEHAKALASFDQALKESKESFGVTRAELIVQKALVYHRWGRKDDCQRASQEAFAILSGHEKNNPEAAHVLVVLAYVANQEEQLDQAQVYLQEALRLSELHKDVREVAVALNNLAANAAKRGDFEKAGELFKKALRDYQRVGDVIGEADTHFQLGNLVYLKGRYQEAADSYDRALDLAVRLNNVPMAAAIQSAWGQLETERGNYSVARIYLDAALQTKSRLGDAKGAAAVFQGYQNLYFHLGEDAEARKWVNRSLEESQDDLHRFNSWIMLSQLTLRQGDLDGSSDALTHAKTLLKDYASPNVQLMFAVQAANVAYGKGDAGGGQEILRAANALLPRISNPILVLYEQWVRHKITTTTPLPILQHFHEEVFGYDNPFLKWNVALLLGEVCERAGEEEQAIGYYRQSWEIITGLAQPFTPESRDIFLRDPEKQRVLQGLDQLSKSDALLKGELEKARHEIQQLKKIIAVQARLEPGAADLETGLDAVLAAAMDLVPAQSGFIVFRGKRRGESSDFLATRGVEPSDFHKALVNEVRQEARPRLIHDAASDLRLPKGSDREQIRSKSIVCIPLSLHGEVKGVLFLDHDEAKGRFTPQHVEVLAILANQAALGLHTLSLLGEAKDTSEQISSELQQAQRLIHSQSLTLQETFQFGGVVGGKDDAMQKVFATLERVIPHATPVLIEGETGTGKELIAQAVHYKSLRKDKPFVAINCGSLAPQLLESELFGHAKGAFTDAQEARDGLFLMANGGTLFLDEVSEMPSEVQPKFLRALQDGEIRPVGSNQLIKVDVRIVSASNKPLADQVKQGHFREDLFYRLNVVGIQLPPLRERLLDFDLLVDHFLKKLSDKNGGKRRAVSKRAREALHRYAWPGNIRELYHVLESVVILATRKTIQWEDLPERVRSGYLPDPTAIQSLKKARVDFHQQYIEALLQLTRGNSRQAAKIAGIRHETLSRFLKKYQVRKGTR